MSKFIKTIKNKKYIISLLGTVLVLIGLISGTSYAILKGKTVSNNEQFIRAGSVELRLTENFNSIDEGVPTMTDVNGLLQETVYEFTVTNIGSVAAKYDLKLLNEAPSGETALSDGYIRLGLEVKGKEMGPMGLTKVNNVIDSNTINEDEVIRYKLRVWFDNSKVSELTGNTNKAYLKLKVEAKQAEYAKKPSGTRIVYRIGENSTYMAYNSQPLTAGTYTGYCAINTNDDYNSCTQENRGFISQDICNVYISDYEGTTCETGSWIVQDSIPYTNDTSSLSGQPFYLKHEIGSQNEPIKSYMCYLLNNNEYCLIGGDGIYDTTNNAFISPSYETNKQILTDSFGGSNCTDETNYYECSSNSLTISASINGAVTAGIGRSFCNVSIDGSSNCDV